MSTRNYSSRLGAIDKSARRISVSRKWKAFAVYTARYVTRFSPSPLSLSLSLDIIGLSLQLLSDRGTEGTVHSLEHSTRWRIIKIPVYLIFASTAARF